MYQSIIQAVTTTAEPAFACYRKEGILAWNEGAERLLGYAGKSVLGKPCHRILCGKDIYGNPYCSAYCPVQEMMRR